MSWVGSFVGIGTLGLLQTWVLPCIGPYIYNALTFFLAPDFKPDYSPVWIIIGSFGATCVLVYGQPQAPPAQPWNTLFGNTIGALIGMSIFQLAELVGLQQEIWLTGSLSVSFTIVAQEITQSQHPPGGATALLTAIMPNLQATHFIYVLCPGFLGPLILVTVSMLVNNLSQVRSYPATWANPWSQPGAAEASKEEPEPSPSTGFDKYLAKFRPKGGKSMPRPPLQETFFSWLGSFIGIATLGLLQQFAMPGLNKAMHLTDLVTIIGSFGAVAVLVNSLPASPLSQPKNALLGDTIGAAVGVAVVKAFELSGLGHCFWLMAALAVSLTIVAQERATCPFPPGGATALIFVLRSCAAGLPAEHPFHISDVWDWYVILPGFFGPWLLVTVALLINNLSPKRSYPTRWWDGA
jgi:CBS-domain-containing membrane protein